MDGFVRTYVRTVGVFSIVFKKTFLLGSRKRRKNSTYAKRKKNQLYLQSKYGLCEFELNRLSYFMSSFGSPGTLWLMKVAWIFLLGSLCLVDGIIKMMDPPATQKQSVLSEECRNAFHRHHGNTLLTDQWLQIKRSALKLIAARPFRLCGSFFLSIFYDQIIWFPINNMIIIDYMTHIIISMFFCVLNLTRINKQIKQPYNI